MMINNLYLKTNYNHVDDKLKFLLRKVINSVELYLLLMMYYFNKQKLNDI